MDSITWPVAALALASITLVLSNVGNEIRRRRRLQTLSREVSLFHGLGELPPRRPNKLIASRPTPIGRIADPVGRNGAVPAPNHMLGCIELRTYAGAGLRGMLAMWVRVAIAIALLLLPTALHAQAKSASRY